MKKLLLAATVVLMGATTACASTPAPKGHWVQGANKMPIFVAARDESKCKLTGPSWTPGPRGVFGYHYACK